MFTLISRLVINFAQASDFGPLCICVGVSCFGFQFWSLTTILLLLAPIWPLLTKHSRSGSVKKQLQKYLQCLKNGGGSKKAGPQSFTSHISEMGSQGQDGDSENTIHNILQLLLGVSQNWWIAPSRVRVRLCLTMLD